MLSDLRVSEAAHENNKVVRVAAVSNKHKVITLVLLTNYSYTNFNMNLTFGEGDQAFKVDSTSFLL